jgi:hypothetical protein
MIIKGKSRSEPSALAAHLGNTVHNERVSLLEARGTVAQDIRGALIEMDAYAAGTRCEKPLYHANIDPQPPHRLTAEQRTEAIDALEEKLGLVGHQRIVVMHEKHGREHFHVVWTRIDIDHMRSVHDGHNYRKHEEVARDLERRFGHERVQGAHHERDGVERPDRTPTRAELRQEERTHIKGKDVKREVTEAFRSCDGPEAFRAALDDKVYVLAKGDRRDFVIVDRAGGIHSLARRIDGMNAAELRDYMKPLDREGLPSIEQAREIMDERRKHIKDSRGEAGIEKSYSRGEDYVSQTTAALKDYERHQKATRDQPRPQHPSDHRSPSVERDFHQESRLLAHFAPTAGAQITCLRNGEWVGLDAPIGELSQRHDYNEASHQKYGRMNQLLYGEGGHENSEQKRQGVEQARKERDERVERLKNADPNDRPIGQTRDKDANIEITDRMQRLLDGANNEQRDRERDRERRNDEDPDRQREAPGGGRTRSR